MARRPIKYKKDVADAILHQFKGGDDLVACCKNHKVAITTFYYWLKKNYGNIAVDYEEAKLAHLDCLSHKTRNYILSPLSKEEKEYPVAFKKRILLIKYTQFELERRYKQYYGNHLTIENNNTIDIKAMIHKLNSDAVISIESSKSKKPETALGCSKVIEHKPLVTKGKK